MLKKFLPQIVAMLFLAGFVAYAWTEPASVPPAGNVEAPINVSTASQYKSGALGIGGLLRGYSDAVIDGNVGIGTTAPSQKLDVVGQIHATEDVCTDIAGGRCLSTIPINDIVWFGNNGLLLKDGTVASANCTVSGVWASAGLARNAAGTIQTKAVMTDPDGTPTPPSCDSGYLVGNNASCSMSSRGNSCTVTATTDSTGARVDAACIGSFPGNCSAQRLW